MPQLQSGSPIRQMNDPFNSLAVSETDIKTLLAGGVLCIRMASCLGWTKNDCLRMLRKLRSGVAPGFS